MDFFSEAIKARGVVRALMLLPWLITAHAQPAPNPPAATFSLEQAKETAFERNWDLLAAKSGMDAAAAQLIVSKEFPNPTASLSAAKIGTHESGTVLGNGLWHRNYDTIFAVSQLIEIAGKRHDRQMAARSGVVGAKARFYDARRTLDQGVTKAYIAALLAGENARILNESSGLLLHEARIAEDRHQAGDLSESDMKQIEINAEQFELQAKSAEAAAVQARIAVQILMGVPQPTGNWVSAESLDQLVESSAPEDQAATAGAARPDLLAAEADLRVAKANLQLQKAFRIPDSDLYLRSRAQPTRRRRRTGGGHLSDWHLVPSAPVESERRQYQSGPSQRGPVRVGGRKGEDPTRGGHCQRRLRIQRGSRALAEVPGTRPRPNPRRCGSRLLSPMKKAAPRWWICSTPNKPTTRFVWPSRKPCPIPPAPAPTWRRRAMSCP